jgi:WD40 repeat protein
VYCAHFNEDESLLVTCSIDKTIKLWDASSGEALHTLVGHSDSVSSVRFSADSAVILSGSKDGSVRVWDWQSGACIHTIHGITSNVLGVTAVLCLEGGAKVVAAADVDVFLFESCMH